MRSHAFDVALRSLLASLVLLGAAFAMSAEPDVKPAAKVDSKSTAEQAIRKALCTKANLVFKDLPLTEFAEKLSKDYGINVVLDKKAMGDVGIDTGTPITAALQGIPLRSALNLVLRNLDLTFYIDNEVLLITTPEMADSHTTTVAYDVTDLIIGGSTMGRTRTDFDFDSLTNLITSHVAPTTWPDGTGPGPIFPLLVGNAAVLPISQTEAVHTEIAVFLERLRGVVRAHANDGKVVPETSPHAPPADKTDHGHSARQAIKKALGTKIDIDFKELPLVDLTTRLSKDHGINVVIDQKAIGDVGVDESSPITQKVKGVSLKSALRLVLDAMNLTAIVRDDVLLITTREVADSHLTTEMYDVTDLVKVRDDKDEVWHDSEQLVEAIQCNVVPKDGNGGPGTLSSAFYCNRTVLVASQTEAEQEQIAALLESLWEKFKAHGKNGETPRRNRPQLPAKSPTGAVGGGFSGATGSGFF